MTQDELKSLAEKASRLGKAYDARTGMGWFARDLRPRVSIDRSSSGSSIWHCGIIRFVPEAGLYGLVAVRDESYLENLKAAFRILGEMGLGGERTYGLGEFEFSGFKPIEKTWPDVVNAFSKSAARRYVLLSRYFPSEGELETLKESLVAWDFEESRGYITSGRQGTTVKRKRLYLIKEGSVSRKPLKGRLVDVTPEAALELGVTHSVFRCGLGLWFPL
jgi:CRISPR-associated protein Csm4